MTDRKTVFLTGATGNMGWAGFQELYKKGKFNIRLLARDSRKNHKKLDRYESDPSVTVIWGAYPNRDEFSTTTISSSPYSNNSPTISPANPLTGLGATIS